MPISYVAHAVAYQQGGLAGGTPSRVDHPAAGRRSQRGKERRRAGGQALAFTRLTDSARDRVTPVSYTCDAN
ncbi:MAG: hypothetical protein HXY39_08670 [Chloroflexi bacterium]|nr:hypothetical protein [Chloroflexota bacterium]